MEAAFYGIGVLAADGESVDMLLEPRPYTPRRHTPVESIRDWIMRDPTRQSHRAAMALHAADRHEPRNLSSARPCGSRVGHPSLTGVT